MTTAAPQAPTAAAAGSFLMGNVEDTLVYAQARRDGRDIGRVRPRPVGLDHLHARGTHDGTRGPKRTRGAVPDAAK